MGIGVLTMRDKVIDENEMLIIRAIKGDDNAFLKLIKDNKEYLYKMAFSYVKDEVDALEVIDEAVYKAYKGIRKLKKPEYFKTWIVRLVINISLDKLKAKKRIVPTEEVINLVAEDKKISVDERLDLKNAIESLNPKYKRAIILKYYNDLTLEEIGEVMGCNVGMIKNYIHRGKKSLSEILKGDYIHG